MQAIQILVEKLFAENSINLSHQKNTDEIFEIMRSKDNVINPMNGMMGRNHRFFASLKFAIRSKLQKQFQAYKALNEAVNELSSLPKATKLTSKQDFS